MFLSPPPPQKKNMSPVSGLRMRGLRPAHWHFSFFSVFAMKQCPIICTPKLLDRLEFCCAIDVLQNVFTQGVCPICQCGLSQPPYFVYEKFGLVSPPPKKKINKAVTDFEADLYPETRHFFFLGGGGGL